MEYKRVLDVDMMMQSPFRKQRHTMKCLEHELADWIIFMSKNGGTIISMTVKEIMVQE